MKCGFKKELKKETKHMKSINTINTKELALKLVRGLQIELGREALSSTKKRNILAIKLNDIVKRDRREIGGNGWQNPVTLDGRQLKDIFTPLKKGGI